MASAPPTPHPPTSLSINTNVTPSKITMLPSRTAVAARGRQSGRPDGTPWSVNAHLCTIAVQRPLIYTQMLRSSTLHKARRRQFSYWPHIVWQWEEVGTADPGSTSDSSLWLLLNSAPAGRGKISHQLLGEIAEKLAALASATCLSGRRPRSIKCDFDFQRRRARPSC